MMTRLNASIKAMEQTCPQLPFSRVVQLGQETGIWRGVVQPISTTEAFLDLLDDLEHDREVWVAGDRITHLEPCGAIHCHHEWMDRVGELQVTFEIEVRYDGGRALPRCYVLSPSIPFDKRKHLWSDGALCAFLASEDVWVWDRDTVADALPHFFIWLVKWLVFDQTGHWMGSQHVGTPSDHLKRIRRNDQCWCGSGRKYKTCHLESDRLKLKRQIQGLPIFESRRKLPKERLERG